MMSQYLIMIIVQCACIVINPNISTAKMSKTYQPEVDNKFVHLPIN